MTQPQDDLEAQIKNLPQDHDGPPLGWDVLKDFADRLLNEKERQRVAEHLVNHPESRRRLESIIQADLDVKAQPLLVDAQAQPARYSLHFFKWAIPVAALAAALVLGFILFTSDKSSIDQWSIQVAELAEDPNAAPSKSLASLHKALLPSLSLRATEHLLIQRGDDSSPHTATLTSIRLDSQAPSAKVSDATPGRAPISKVLGSTAPGIYLLALSETASASHQTTLNSLSRNSTVRDSLSGGLSAVTESLSQAMTEHKLRDDVRILVLQLMP